MLLGLGRKVGNLEGCRSFSRDRPAWRRRRKSRYVAGYRQLNELPRKTKIYFHLPLRHVSNRKTEKPFVLIAHLTDWLQRIFKVVSEFLLPAQDMNVLVRRRFFCVTTNGAIFKRRGKYISYCSYITNTMDSFFSTKQRIQHKKRGFFFRVPISFLDVDRFPKLDVF